MPLVDDRLCEHQHQVVVRGRSAATSSGVGCFVTGGRCQPGTLAECPQPQRQTVAIPEALREMLADGWTLDYSADTGFVGLSHPRGGKQSLLEICKGRRDQGIGEFIVAALSAPVKREAAAVAPDANVEAVRTMLIERSVLGLAKYGTTTERKDLSGRDWLQHLQEELLDAAVYVQALKSSSEAT